MIRFITIAALSITLTATAVAQAPYSQLVVFGDSLSDTGNTFALTNETIPPTGPGEFPYATGRFANGLIWIDFLKQDLGFEDAEVLNFAFGGARTGFGFNEPPPGIFDGPAGLTVPTVGTQIAAYLLADQPDPDQLTILWAGANDLLMSGSPEATVANLEQHIRALETAGADEFLIPNLPPLGDVPAVDNWFQSLVLNVRTVQFNWLLSQRLSDLEAELPIKIHRLNTYSLTLLGTQFSFLFGFTNTNDAALADIATGAITPAEGANYFYWDVLHPTSKVHRVLASFSLAALKSH
jgi:phospholipase/lecithinase/hemolysin